MSLRALWHELNNPKGGSVELLAWLYDGRKLPLDRVKKEENK
jgi:hypothetical protein